jgi:hypothetical protein
MNTVSLDHPRSRRAFRAVKLLVGGYLAVSVATLTAIVLMRNEHTLVNAAVWIRGTIVVASALVMISFAVRAARGSASAYRRLRIVSAAMVVAIAVIISLPGTFPAWMKIEQAVCGALLVAVAVIANSRLVRSLFAAG